MVATATGLVAIGFLVCLVMAMQPDGKEDAGRALATAVADTPGGTAPAWPVKKPNTDAQPAPSVTPAAGATASTGAPSGSRRR
ncbi:hypothetical protein [Streptomyces sp. PvR034]|uniref:hypothetical protein n=1 Tax=Streptomyces sp. PvR034 TaxID=3156401 RepID=UPI00339900BA